MAKAREVKQVDGVSYALLRGVAALLLSLLFAAPSLGADEDDRLPSGFWRDGESTELFSLYQWELARAYRDASLFYLTDERPAPQQALTPTPEQEVVIEEGELVEDPIYDAPPGAMLGEGFRNWLQHTPFFGHGIDDVRDPRRHFGVGVPLEGTSWRNRPWHVGLFVGFLDGGVVANGMVQQDSGLMWGMRLGNDFDHYWGWELRAGTAQIDLSNHATGVPLPQHGRNTYYDIDLLYYPLGDTRWRPYVSLGLGASTHGFADLQGNSYDESTATLPISLGVKYFVRPGMSIRADFTNNISFGTANASGTDNISLLLGFDLHFGGRRKVYYPFDPSFQVW